MEQAFKISYTTDLRTTDIKTCDASVYQEMCQNFNCYEITPDDRKIKPYFDIEIKQKHCEEGQEYVNCLEDCLLYATKFLDREFLGAKYCALNASSADYKCCVTGEQKWILSLHLIISNYLVSKSKLKSLVIKMNQAINNELNNKNERCEKITDWYDFSKNADGECDHKFFDEGVYDKKRKIRSPYANKNHYHKDTNKNVVEDRPMELLGGTFEQSVISAFNDPDTIEMTDDETTSNSEASSKSNFKPASDNGITDNSNFAELKFYAENGAFKYAMGLGCHTKWISLAGMLVSILPIVDAFQCWELATLRDGTDNKKDEYETKFDNIKMLEEDPIKAMNSLKKIVKKEAPTIFNNWKQKQQDILDEWKKKACDEIKAQKEKLRLQKEAEKSEKDAIRQAAKEEREAASAAKEERKNKKETISAEREYFIEKHKKENIFIDNDNDACDIIFERLKGIIIFVNNRFYYKYKNCWINDKDKINSLVMVFIAESNIYKINEDYDLKPYGQNTKNAKNIMELLYSKVRIKCDTQIKYATFHSSTKKKLCFLDGVLDFEKKTFTLWKNLTVPIYTTIIIQRNYATYFQNPNRVFIDKIKDDIFANIFGNKTNLALKFFARAIAGCCEDKNFMSYSGNRNCGKGILYNAVSSAFEEYVTSFNLENMVCKRESNKSSDIAKENAWLLPLEFARIAIAQETDENENDNIKNGLKISNKVMKSVMSGGDEIKARPLYSDPINITLDATLGFFGNNELAISGEDSNQHHFKFAGVKQFITAEKHKSYESMGADFLSAYAIRDETLKDKVRTDDYTNAMVYLLFEHFENKCLTIDNIETDDGEQLELSIRALIFKHYEITKDDKDRVSKDDMYELLKKDKKKIIAELKQLNCVGDDKCRTTIDIEKIDENGKPIIVKKQVQAFKNLKLKIVIAE